jgi:predicted adenine nucleotide alpha hydrolase (AANH) superfamily ATPase
LKILLHICCSNCALYPVKIIRADGHDFAGLWFNPNIHPYDEYKSRLDSLKNLSNEWKIDILYFEDFNPVDYFELFNITDTNLINNIGSNGLNGLNIPPSPERCKSCYRLRLEKTAEQAQKKGFDAFSSTLLISPYQDFEQIATIGQQLAEKYNVIFHLKDYRPYFSNAMALSKELGLYRQKYCGCIFSREERKNKGFGSKIQGFK